MESGLWIMAVGFAAQGFFAARILAQWILSERAGTVLSPSVFWVFSITGAFLMTLYGYLRHDFAIILGQFVSYYIYLWNLRLKGIWAGIWLPVRVVLFLTPIAAICLGLQDFPAFAQRFLGGGSVPLWLVLFGSGGQLLFTFRFVYQLVCSKKRGESVLPRGFWLISVLGSLTIVAYGIFRHDAVLIVGQSFGLVSYIRNLVMGSRLK